jgi:lactoylglutathione lyase
LRFIQSCKDEQLNLHIFITLLYIPYYMKIEHLAVWTNQLDALKAFYVQFFNAVPNEKYHNPRKQFSSYFLCFDEGARLELMQMPGIPNNSNDTLHQNTGLIHFAVSTGSKEKVDALTEEIRKAGFSILGEPRWTGDGYYESVILDPDNNRIEITI